MLELLPALLTLVIVLVGVIASFYFSRENLHSATKATKALAEAERKAFIETPDELARLFNLYSKQIEKYQQETRSRATLSFIFAIAAMFAGFGFVIWGWNSITNCKRNNCFRCWGTSINSGGNCQWFHY